MSPEHAPYVYACARCGLSLKMRDEGKRSRAIEFLTRKYRFLTNAEVCVCALLLWEGLSLSSRDSDISRSLALMRGWKQTLQKISAAFVITLERRTRTFAFVPASPKRSEL